MTTTNDDTSFWVVKGIDVNGNVFYLNYEWNCFTWSSRLNLTYVFRFSDKEKQKRSFPVKLRKGFDVYWVKYHLTEIDTELISSKDQTQKEILLKRKQSLERELNSINNQLTQ